MLDQLRAMGVFACVVEKNSFSGAARELGITTSAVSQQIRSLEQDMDVVLLHRSTRKLSLTEAGQAFFHSCQEMLSAAQRGKLRINELRDDLVGELRIASTPELCANHIAPALAHWMTAHRGLSVHFDADNQYIDLIDERIDIALRISESIDEQSVYAVPLAQIGQVLVASPSFINHSTLISRPEDLTGHDLLVLNFVKNHNIIAFNHRVTGEKVNIEMTSRLSTNSILVAKSMCQQGQGIARILFLDAQKDLMNGSLIEVLPEWKLPAFTLYAVVARREQQPAKIQRCLDALKQYFSQLPGGRVYLEAS
ncbi:LysR family transcriptional regulator [Acinetobacter pragensis]|uniref:LysR family transcriptional regulator n=1 Tax=Acinetobacter pragensis TaxID=1806892 RepID=A0A151Y1X6_9GAMM|nr:LysR family transcriptional regulator [Acinetobacter pragensis]KYQ72024.1 LysR family transcriptional regulator [Acinetobacter pragensis]